MHVRNERFWVSNRQQIERRTARLVHETLGKTSFATHAELQKTAHLDTVSS